MSQKEEKSDRINGAAHYLSRRYNGDALFGPVQDLSMIGFLRNRTFSKVDERDLVPDIGYSLIDYDDASAQRSRGKNQSLQAGVLLGNN